MNKLMPEGRDELMTRWSLIRKVRNSDCDEESWATFYQIYQNLVYAVARKAGLRHEEAQDAVQETMRTVYDNIQNFNPDPALGTFKGWLLKTASWKITDQLRKRARQPASAQPRSDDSERTATVERLPDPASLNVDSACEEEWQKKLFAAAVERIKDKVSPDQYQIFDFYVLREMPVTKVARSLGVNVGQVYLARHRTLKLIRQEIKVLEKKIR